MLSAPQGAALRCTRSPAAVIDYKDLRRSDPETARKAVLHYLESVDCNVSATARAFGVTRNVVYDIVRRAREGSLEARSRVPHRQPTKTPRRIENRVVRARNRTGLGYRELRDYLAERGLELPWSTIRNILKRNAHRVKPKPRKRRSKPPPGEPPPPPDETRLQKLRRRVRKLAGIPPEFYR